MKNEPEFRLFVVMNGIGEGDRSTWTELAPLWRGKDGQSLSGPLGTAVPVILPRGVRLVVLPAKPKDTPAPDAHQHNDDIPF